MIKLKSKRFAETHADLALIFNVKPRRVAEWLALSGIQKSAEGWPVAEIREWRRANVGPLRGSGKREPTSDETALLEARGALRQAKAQLLEHELKIQRCELIPRGKFDPWNLSRIQVMKRNLLDLHLQVAPQLMGLPELAVRAILQAHVDSLMRRWPEFPL